MRMLFAHLRVICTEERARVVPLHLLLSKLDPKVIDQLLRYCCKSRKKGGASPYILILNSFDPLITGFGREALNDDMLKFVINVVTKSIDLVSLSTN